MSTIRIALFGICLLTMTVEARAFCVRNETAAAIHAQALDVITFEADIRPAAHVCCEGAHCVNPKKGGATVLVVTGYVPVKSSAGKPGWDAECRALVPQAGWLQVTGDASTVRCTAHPERPTDMR